VTIRVIGAGVGRTGTASLKAALEILLGGPCYHMHEVASRPQDVPVWHQAALGNMPNWHVFLKDWVAAVDWPASAYWQELADTYPDALIILSTRDAEAWWQSMSNTIIKTTAETRDGAWLRMFRALMQHRFTSDIANRPAAIAAFEAHNARVRKTAPSGRLIEWQASDGWAPLCAALGVGVPDQEFPHNNTTAEFAARTAHNR